MLQGVIARMGSNSFTLKALVATFGSAAIAVMATAQKPYLKGAYIEVVQTKDTVYFDVTFPNQDDRDSCTSQKHAPT